MKALLLAFAMAAISLIASAQTETKTVGKPEILILGTYHMGNPGRDIYNMQADDVLAPKRQQEIAQVIEVLKRFKPTKIAIESEVGSKKRTQEYSDYLAGKFTLSRNEIDQIGYRLAKEMGHKEIYPVDVDGDFPMLRVQNWAKANGKGDKLEALSAGWGFRVKEQDAFLKSHTVLEMLEMMNDDKRVAEDVALYFALVPYGEPWEYAGPDLLASWYQRNIRIYHNVRTLATEPNDRILVIYGAGHLGWLQQDVQNDASVKLRKLAEFAEKK